jgi:hypothetical protein
VLGRPNDARGKRPLHLVTRVSVAAAFGVAATLATRAFAGSSCTQPEVPAFASTCSNLVASLSVRLGIVVGLVALLIELTRAGLLRTAEELDDRRHELALGDPR